MIKPGYLRKQLEKSRNADSTSSFLQRLTFGLVHDSLTEVYGENLSTLCLQGAVGVQWVLSELGIQSRLWQGAVCVPEFKEDPGVWKWSGFWDQHHHVWVVTEFLEYVDLTIGHLSRHPQSQGETWFGPPAIWNPGDTWPDYIKYLPTAPIAIGLQGTDRDLLDQFKRNLRERLQSTLASQDVSDLKFGPILADEQSFMELVEADHPWALRCLNLDQIVLPLWITNRENELRLHGLSHSQT